jgi:antirestriction protein
MKEETKERLIQALIEHAGLEDLEEAEEYFEENYIGEFLSEREFSQFMVENSGHFENASEFLISHFDYHSFYQDLMIGDCFEIDYHYFYNR